MRLITIGTATAGDGNGSRTRDRFNFRIAGKEELSQWHGGERWKKAGIDKETSDAKEGRTESQNSTK